MYNLIITIMRNYLLLLNGAVIADYVTMGRALNAYSHHMCRVDSGDILELYDVRCSRNIACNF